MWKDKSIETLLSTAAKLSAKLRTPIVRLQMNIEHVKNAVMNQVTRWNSTFLMLERLMDIKQFCEKFGGEKGFEELKMKKGIWDKFEALVKLLKIVAELTTQLQAENLIVPDFIYFWFVAKQKLEAMTDSEDARKLLRCIEERDVIIFKN